VVCTYTIRAAYIRHGGGGYVALTHVRAHAYHTHLAALRTLLFMRALDNDVHKLSKRV